MKKLSLFLVIALVFTGGFSVPKVLAMSDIDLIAANCQTAQAVLGQIEKVDTGLRINRGHDYNELLDLMFTMNARLAANKIAAPNLSSITSKFERALVDFRNNYDNYDNDLEKILNIRCTTKPLEFYNALDVARAARAILKNDIENLDRQITDYHTQLSSVVETHL